MSDQNNTPPPPDVELQFQMQAMTKMMERMNFMMGKHGNVAGKCTQDVRKDGAEPKSNIGSGAERPRWADYKEDVDDIGLENVRKGFNKFSLWLNWPLVLFP
jgi:hypothetical protein